MKKEPNLGDRYQWRHSEGNLPYEIIELVSISPPGYKCLAGSRKGEIIYWDGIGNSITWKYVGNFIKSKKFNNLYSKLCESI